MKISFRKISAWGAAALFATVAVVALVNGSPRNFFVDDTRFSKEIHRAAARHRVPPQLVRALIFQESRFDPNARGYKGEIGLMQLLPSGAVADWARINKVAEPGEDELFDPVMNLEIGCWYLGRALRRWHDYKEGIALALAQYNAGEGRAKRWKPGTKDGKVLSRITISSTRRYVEQIIRRYRSYIQ
ncbi:MAG: lytic transglycosylase domain-containing protein [Lentisphaeria bacterium]|nr:lytic transglycosylase domain-containing protein [Lentisphaeria bacterium]